MAVIKAFECIRPDEKVADRVAALPYDVYNREEALKEVEREPLSFLAIDRAETQFDSSVDTYADCVYDKARELLDSRIADGTFITDTDKAYYVYELTMNGRTQTGIAACASIDDYNNNIIKKHENTRADKEQDRINHVDRCSAQTGPIFPAYRADEVIRNEVAKAKETKPLYSFTSPDGIRHQVYKISNAQSVENIEKAFADVQGAYPMINQQFVEHECMDYTYVNREDDAGEEGLRKAKLSYRPAFLEEKGFVTRIGGQQ